MTTRHRMAVTGLGVIAPGLDGPAGALSPAQVPEPGWFQLSASLPGRGYKRLPTGCQYLLAATRRALQDTGDHLAHVAPERRGAVMGTNNAGAALLDSMDRTIIDGSAAELSPSSAPFMAMSGFSSRLSPEYRLNGFNLTTNSPGTAGLEALQIAARALAADRASALLVGVTEEAPPVDQFSGAADIGAAVLFCESVESAAARNASVYGFCEARSAFLDPAEDSAEMLDRLLGDGPPPDRIDAVLDGSLVGIAVAAWLAVRAPAAEIVIVPIPVDAGCLTPVRRVVGLLVSRPGRRVVLTASAQGNVALAELTTSTTHDGS